MSVPVTDILDVQSLPDQRNIIISQVGIRDIRHPFLIALQNGQSQPTVGNWKLSIELDAHTKGTHMSRFVEHLHTLSSPLSLANFPDILSRLTARLDAKKGAICVDFMFFLEKIAPRSGVKSLLDYQASYFVQSDDIKTTTGFTITVPVTSLCPCSKQISQYGAHNQRSHLTLTAHVKPNTFIENYIRLLEKQASCDLYGILKRVDEKFVTEYAYENAKFVEDMVRDIALALNKDPKILYYKIESENFESIHNHSAYAMIEKDKSVNH